MNENKFQLQEIPVGKIYSEASNPHPEVSDPRPPSFQENHLIICSTTLTYLKRCMDNQYVRKKVWMRKYFDIHIWVHIYTYRPERKKKFRLDKEKRDGPILIWKCNVHHFQPTKTDCSKLFKLKTDGDSTHTNINVSQPQVRKLGKKDFSTASKQVQKRTDIPQELLKVYELWICR